MPWKFIALGLFILGIIVLPLWLYSRGWTYYPMGFCFFLAALVLLISVFARRGGNIWRSGGQKPPG